MIVAASFRRMTETEPLLESIAGINMELEQAGSLLLMTEKTVERCWALALELKSDWPSSWLLLARLAETALLCAGNYADNCEFRAAGDFLVNPREIVVHSRGGRSTIKKRHGRISEQFGPRGVDHLLSAQRFAAGVHLEITKLPLLPHMTQILEESGRVAQSFLCRLENCQRRVADALAFLAAWRIFDSVDLWRRLKASSPHERAFAESHLCRFDAQVFHQIGADVQRSLADSHYQSPFLVWSQKRANRLNRSSPLPARKLVESSA
jgi:hypothetical protein